MNPVTTLPHYQQAGTDLGLDLRLPSPCISSCQGPSSSRRCHGDGISVVGGALVQVHRAHYSGGDASLAQELVTWLEDTVQMAAVPSPPVPWMVADTVSFPLCPLGHRAQHSFGFPRKKILLQFPREPEKEKHCTSQSK